MLIATLIRCFCNDSSRDLESGLARYLAHVDRSMRASRPSTVGIIVRYQNGEENINCVICLEEFKDGDSCFSQSSHLAPAPPSQISGPTITLISYSTDPTISACSTSSAAKLQLQQLIIITKLYVQCVFMHVQFQVGSEYEFPVISLNVCLCQAAFG
ncbi:hypothetical protein V6N13_046170 [Hibiscus sabdariffa]